MRRFLIRKRLSIDEPQDFRGVAVAPDFNRPLPSSNSGSVPDTRIWSRFVLDWEKSYGVFRGLINLGKSFFLQFLLFGYAFATLISIGSVLLEEMTFRRYSDWREVARGTFSSHPFNRLPPHRAGFIHRR